MIFVNKISKALISNYFKSEREMVGIVNYKRGFRISKDKFEIIEKYPFINSVALKFAKDGLFSLALSDSVNFVSSVAEASSLLEISKKTIAVEKLYEGKYLGRGMRICILDSGIFPHMDFLCPKMRLVHFEDMINGKISAYDDNGHGTMVAGVSAGNGLLSGGKFSGIAREAELISVKCMNERGIGSSMDILRGMQWVYDNRRRKGIDILCMSLGAEFQGNSDPLCQGVETLIRSGMIVAVAAGNDGAKPSTIKAPGAAASAITVGSFSDMRTLNREDDIVAEFSSRGPTLFGAKPNLLLPGVSMTAPSVFSSTKENYQLFSGTSVSAAMCAGILAVIKEKYNVKDQNQAKKVLASFANKKYYDKNIEGEGLVYFD